MPERSDFTMSERKSCVILLERSIAPEISTCGIAAINDFVKLGRIEADNSDTNRAVIGSKSSGMVKSSTPVKIYGTFSIAGDVNLKIRIGTRTSPLALAQVDLIAEQIKSFYPDAEIITVPIKVSGDKLTSPLSSDPLGLKGMFTLEIEKALRDGEIDLAVHSLKDLPANVSPDLPVAAYSVRGNPRDALVMNENGGNVLGTSSLRRRLQIERLFPDFTVVPVRGNIGTRLQKLDNGEYSGLILSVSGLQRLGLSHRITRVFSVDEVIPAPGQGILACQARIDKPHKWLECVNDETSRDCAVAERSFARCLGAGCNLPVGAYAEINGEMLTLKGFFADGGILHRGVLSGKRVNAEIIGRNLAEVIMN